MDILTRTEVVSTLGPMDDQTVIEIIGTGATLNEVEEARAWFENDDALVDVGMRPPEGRTKQIVEILSSLEDCAAQEPV